MSQFSLLPRNLFMEICFLLLSIYFYFLDFGSDILLDIEQYRSLKQNDDKFTLTSFFNRSFIKHYCENLEMSTKPVNEDEGERELMCLTPRAKLSALLICSCMRSHLILGLVYAQCRRDMTEDLRN